MEALAAAGRWQSRQQEPGVWGPGHANLGSHSVEPFGCLDLVTKQHSKPMFQRAGWNLQGLYLPWWPLGALDLMFAGHLYHTKAKHLWNSGSQDVKALVVLHLGHTFQAISLGSLMSFST